MKHALLIGINYTNAGVDTEYPPLRRAQKDTKAFRKLLISAFLFLPAQCLRRNERAYAGKYGYLPENIVMMLDEEGVSENLVPTRANIVSAYSRRLLMMWGLSMDVISQLYQIRKLVRNAKAGGRYVFYCMLLFSLSRVRPDCRVAQTLVTPVRSQTLSLMKKTTGSMNVSSWLCGVCLYVPDQRFPVPFLSHPADIVPVDHARLSGSDLKMIGKRMIIDNVLRQRLVDPLPVGSFLTAVFDSCHSGTMLDLDHYLCNRIYVPWVSPGERRYKTLWQRVRRRDGQGECVLLGQTLE